MASTDRPHVLIALHGHGDDPESARRWADALVERLEAGAPAAPSAAAPASSWTVLTPGASIDVTGTRSWFGTGPRGADPADLADAVSLMGSLIDEAYGAGDDPVVVLAGFSQGAAVVLEAIARGQRLDAAVSIAGFLPEYDYSGGYHEPPVSPVLLVAGTSDEFVPDFMSADAAALLSGLGAPSVTLDRVDAGHVVNDAVLDRVASRLGAVLRHGEGSDR